MTYIKYKPGGNSTPSALKAVINYCLQPYKTQIGEQVFCTSGKDCVPGLAYKQFMATKAAFGKTDGVSFYHYVQSFSPEENVTPQEANKIALELAEAWKGHEVLVSTHIDRMHIHSHILINSVSFKTGLKLRQSPKTLEQLRKRSDEICAAHDLSVLKPYVKPPVSGIKTGEYRTAVRGDSWKFWLCSAINQAMDMSWTREQFTENMRRLGYGIRWTDERKSITYTCRNEPKFKDGSYRKCRDNKLHEEKYLKENMEYEFTIRHRKYKQALNAGRTDRTECSGIDRDGEALRAGGLRDSERAMGRNARRADAFGSVSAADVGEDQYACITGETGKLCVGDRADRGKVYDGYADADAEGTSNSDRFGSENDGSADGGDEEFHRTGWERSREKLFSDQDGFQRVQSTDAKAMEYHRVGINWFGSSVIGGIGAGILSAASLIDSDGKNKTPEEIEAEERARQAGSAVGLALGAVIGTIAALKDECGENHDVYKQTPNENESPAAGDCDSENEDYSNENGYTGPRMGGM